jgi:hypothetical protein
MKKKISRVSPCFPLLKFLKTALLGDIKQWESRRFRYRRRYCRRYRRSRPNVENKMFVMVSRKITKVLKGRVSNRSFVGRSSARSSVRSCRGA